MLTLDGFNKLMKIMGIRISTYIEDRLFKVIDSDRQKKIDFYHIMVYFNTILKGDRTDRMRFCYYLIDT